MPKLTLCTVYYIMNYKYVSESLQMLSDGGNGMALRISFRELLREYACVSACMSNYNVYSITLL